MRFVTFERLKTDHGIPYTRRHIRRLVLAGTFPRPVQLSEKRNAWIELEIEDYKARLIAARDDAEGAAGEAA
jgi:prophage regulatory protein